MNDAANRQRKCRAKESIEALTEQQRAGSQGPADLHVMDVHVLTGNVLHWNLFCNLLTTSKNKYCEVMNSLRMMNRLPQSLTQ